MLFAFHLVDRADAARLRQGTLAEHRAYLARHADRIAFAGALSRDEPFTRAGGYAESMVRPFRNRWPQKTGFAEA